MNRRRLQNRPRRFDPEFLAGANHAQRDLTAIGNQDLLEHELTILGKRIACQRIDPIWHAMRLSWN